VINIWRQREYYRCPAQPYDFDKVGSVVCLAWIEFGFTCPGRAAEQIWAWNSNEPIHDVCYPAPTLFAHNSVRPYSTGIADHFVAVHSMMYRTLVVCSGRVTCAGRDEYTLVQYATAHVCGRRQRHIGMDNDGRRCRRLELEDSPCAILCLRNNAESAV
jgi:hypothetical protein